MDMSGTSSFPEYIPTPKARFQAMGVSENLIPEKSLVYHVPQMGFASTVDACLPSYSIFRPELSQHTWFVVGLSPAAAFASCRQQHEIGKS